MWHSFEKRNNHKQVYKGFHEEESNTQVLLLYKIIATKLK